MRWKVLYKRKVILQIGTMTPPFFENEYIISMLDIIDSLPFLKKCYSNDFLSTFIDIEIFTYFYALFMLHVSIWGNKEYWNDQYIQIRNSNRLQENFNVQCRTKKGSDNWIRLFSFLIDFWDKVIKRRIYIASGYSFQYHLTRTLRWAVNCDILMQDL